MNSEEFLSAAQLLLQFIVKYRNGAFSREFPVLPNKEIIQPNYLKSLISNKAPENKESFNEILKDIEDKIIPGVSQYCNK